MSLSPFCFVHATNVRLDQPLWGIGNVDGEARRLAEEATNLAFERIVETCIEQHAAFLLLTGNTLDAAHGHRALMLLERACEQLADHDCQVLILPGETDPAHTWNRSVDLPENATILVGAGGETVTVSRDDEPLATVEAFRERQHAVAHRHAGGLRIALASGYQHADLCRLLAQHDAGQLGVSQLEQFPSLVHFAYLAVGGGSERLTVQLPNGLAHDPGCPQPLDGRNTAGLGCTVIEVDEAGTLHTRLIPTAVVRREEVDVSVTAEMSWDDLLEAMQNALSERPALPSERLWLVRWVIGGEGEVIDQLMVPSARDELIELVEGELSADSDLERIHQVEVNDRWSDSLDMTAADSVSEEFCMLIDEQLDEHVSQFRRGLAARDWPEEGWVRHLIDAGEQIESQNVAARTRRLARDHLVEEPRKTA